MADVVVLKRSGLKFVPVATTDTIVTQDIKFVDKIFGKTDVLALEAHVASTANPHSVTKAQVLSGNEIVNADVAVAAAIAESKLALDFSTSSLDGRISALVSGSSFGAFAKVITVDVAPAEGNQIDLTAFSDDQAPLLTAADFAVNDLIIFDANGTPAVGKISAIAVNLATITYVGVTALAQDVCYHVKFNLLAGAGALEKRAIYSKSATVMVKVADEVWDSAVGIQLSTFVAQSGTITGADSVLSALEKLEFNKVAKSQIKTILSGNESVDVPSVSAVNDGLLTKIDEKIALINAEVSTMNAGSVAYLNAGDAKLAGNDLALTIVQLEFMFIAVASINASASGDFYKGNTKLAITGTKGNVAYLGTGGAMVTTEPVSGDIVVLGEWIATDVFYFKPRYIVTK